MEVLSTLLEGCQTLAGQMQRQHGSAFAAGELMQDLAGLAGERWTTGSRFSGIANHLGIQDPQARIALLTGCKALVRNMPPKVFADPEARLNLVNAAQEALDEGDRSGRERMNDWIAQTLDESAAAWAWPACAPPGRRRVAAHGQRAQAGLPGAGRWCGDAAGRAAAAGQRAGGEVPRARLVPAAPRPAACRRAPALARDGRLVFTTRLPAREFKPHRVEEALDLLTRLHAEALA